MSEPFLYGAATSAHQVEGDNVNNDWWAWEKEKRERHRSGKAADHYHCFKEDFALAKNLGHNAHRLSLEWSRIEPAPGEWGEREIQHYREVLTELRRQGLTSFVTLHHFTNPIWVARSEGWESRETVKHFLRYVQKVVEELGELVDFWVTINEPAVYAMQGYWQNLWPPGKKSWWAVERVMRNFAVAHRQAYATIHKAFPSAQVGIAKHFIAELSPVPNWWFNHRFLRRTQGTHDFLGVNYYFPSKWQVWDGPKSDLGWPVYPKGLTQILLDLRQYRLPIYITENGVADARDRLRSDFIRDHLRAVEKAQVRGADVRGYLHWSLLDNFEWHLGFAPRFGLVEVDYKTLARKPRPSAYVYKAIIEQAQSF